VALAKVKRAPPRIFRENKNSGYIMFQNEDLIFVFFFSSKKNSISHEGEPLPSSPWTDPAPSAQFPQPHELPSHCAYLCYAVIVVVVAVKVAAVVVEAFTNAVGVDDFVVELGALRRVKRSELHGIWC